MLDLSDLEKGADANSNGRTAITGIAIVVAMVTSLVLAISYFVPIPVAVGLIAGALWILSLITAIVLAAIQPGGLWQSLKRAAKMLISWVAMFG